MAYYRVWAASASRRDFVVVDYDLTSSGAFFPRRPTQCHRRTAQGSPCRLVVNHWRSRPTLELGQLLVLECRVHAVAFTVYPMALAPYQRAPTLTATPDGREAPSSSEGGHRCGLKGTLLEAAQEARDGGKWYSREPGNRKNVKAPEPGALQWRGSRLRQLERSENWLGLSPELDDAARVERASVLGVEALSLKQASHAVSLGTLRQRGAAVCAILEAMVPTAAGGPGCRLERLLWAGHQAGLWGRPWIWETAARGWRAPVFREAGPGRQTQPRSAPASPTSLLVDRREGLV